MKGAEEAGECLQDSSDEIFGLRTFVKIIKVCLEWWENTQTRRREVGTTPRRREEVTTRQKNNTERIKNRQRKRKC